MTKGEFIKTACKMGYCTEKQAEKYSEGKDELTEDDFIEVYRKREGERRTGTHRYLGDGAYTSKRYYRDGGEEGNR